MPASQTREKRSGSYTPATKEESKEKEHANGASGGGVRFKGLEEHDREKAEKPKKSLDDSAKSEDDSSNYATVRIKEDPPEESSAPSAPSSLFMLIER